MYLKPGNHMNMKRSFIVASILCLRDTCFLYPACYECGSRLLLNLGRYHCLKHGYVSTAQDMHYRYRLSVKVARKNDLFNITVFGSCLEPYFGETAGCLQRYCEGLKKKLQEQKEKKNQDLLVQAVKHCFIGRSFIFGVKASEFLPSTWSPSLSPLQAPISMKKYETHLVACQIAVPNTAIYGCTVINYYKKLLDLDNLQDCSPSSMLSDSPFNTVDQSSAMIKSSTSLLSGNAQSFTELNDANRLSNPWQQDFALVLSSGDCVAVEDLSTADTRRVLSKYSPSYHAAEKCQNRKCNTSTLLHFPTSDFQSSDINRYSPPAMVSLPLPNDDCMHQYCHTIFELQKDCVNSSFNKQRYCLQNSGDSLSNGKDCDENQSIDKSYNLSEDSMDHIDPMLWDDLLFSESLDEFIAKVEANQQRCDEEVTVDNSIYSCSLKKLKTDNLLNRTRGQSPRCKEVCTNSTNCNLKRPREFGTEESPCVDSKNPKGLLNRVVDVFKNDITRKENSLTTAPPVLPVDGSIPNDTCPPTQNAVLQIYSTFMNPVNVGNCSTKCVRTCEPKLHNLEKEPLDEYSKFLSERKATEVNKLADSFYIANESDLLNNIGLQTHLPSGKQILKMKKSIDHEFQDSMCIKGHYMGKCDIKPVSISQLSSGSTFYKNTSFQNMSTHCTEQEYNVSGDLFNDTGSDKDEPSTCLRTNLSILSKSFYKINDKLNEQQCSILLCSSDAAVKIQNNNDPPESDVPNVSEHDFSDSQDFVPFSQSTPVSRLRSLKSFRGREIIPLKMSPCVGPSPRSTGFRQRQNGHLKHQLSQMQKVSQWQFGSNPASVSLNSSLLSNSPISTSYDSDSDEWIPPSTAKTRVLTSHLSCVSKINKSQGVKLFRHMSYANAAIETADLKAAIMGNKENESDNHCRGNLYMKRPPAGKHTAPSLQNKVFNSTKVLPNKAEMFGPLISSEPQIHKGLKVNDCSPAAFHSFYMKSEAPSCCSPELF
ncbi:DNA damage-induced apoptosis suppressor protein [Chiloscyllium plagiosum]|uniref:DNA damage-induced apoptosis suppressor protein n=1 Tax=Chiloscyllium plagiosum TaxID=36176 RepID=UPI001CB7C879|nr:DNA damage-induced apoptosis suppressor protein [Chiloscyllium plagiosum]